MELSWRVSKKFPIRIEIGIDFKIIGMGISYLNRYTWIKFGEHITETWSAVYLRILFFSFVIMWIRKRKTKNIKTDTEYSSISIEEFEDTEWFKKMLLGSWEVDE